MFSASDVQPVLGLQPQEWDVITSVVTAAAFLVAAVVAWIAFRQLQHNRAAHRDQTRPYVMVNVDRSPESFSMLDLVVENVGKGPAMNVQMRATPPFRRAKDDGEHPLWRSRLFTESISMLPPGFRIETFFDSAIDRNESEEPLPASRTVNIVYEDSTGHTYSETHAVDVTIWDDLLFGEVYGTHHVAKALRDIEKLLKVTNKHLENPIAVTTQDRDAYEAQVRAEREAQRERMRKGQARLAAGRAAQETGHDAGASPGSAGST
jgi:hypothetical protein